MADQLSIALKEWAVTCRALAEGRQIVLLRKGGILEALDGFQIEHERFLLFPTYLHQNPSMMKPQVQPWHEPHTAEPEKITIGQYAEVTDIVKVKNRTQIDRIDDQHIWTAPLIDMRFNYRPQNPLYLVLVRAYRLPNALTIDNTPAYAGCKSWVPLTDAVDVRGSVPALDDALYGERREMLLGKLEG